MVNQLPSEAKQITSIAGPENAMYVIFTSGSTGQPKGVVVEHSAACSSIVSHGEALGFNRRTRMFQFASYAFDACITEIFTALAHGGCVCVPSDTQRVDSTAQIMEDMRVNTALLTPSVIRILHPKQVPHLQTLIVGGEAAGQDILEIWADRVQLRAAYGPTECSVMCSTGSLRTGATQPNNIGRAVGSSLWIVDSKNHDKLLAIGAIGELLIQGPILARGYLNDPEKTASRFVESLSWMRELAPGRTTRLYKTGDLVQYNSDGTLNFIERIDSQRKLHGLRIEMGEVEFQIRAHMKNVQQLLVDIVQPTDHQARETLVAFLSLNDQRCCLRNEKLEYLRYSNSQHTAMLGLKGALRGKLPGYMVPTLFILLKELPVTQSGKLDRKLLVSNVSELNEEQYRHYCLSDSQKKMPSTYMEKRLQELWAKELKKSADEISVEDDISQMANSLSVISLSAKARESGILLTTADIWRYPTIAQLATVAVSEGRTISTDPDPPPFSLIGTSRDRAALLIEIKDHWGFDASIEDIYPCTPLQEGLMALTSKEPGAYVNRRVFRLATTIDETQFRASWNAVIRASAILRTRIVKLENLGFCQIVLDGAPHWDTADSLQECLETNVHHTMGLGRHLTRFTIVKEMRDGLLTKFFVWTIHHALYDGWSMPKLLERVSFAYANIKVPPAPAFQRFIKYLVDSDLEKVNSFWARYLSTYSTPSFPAKPSLHYQPRVDRTLTTEMSITSIDRKVTVSSIIRAAWALLIARCSNADDVVFGAVCAGRNAPIAGIDSMTGPTITTVPVRVRIDHRQDIGDFLTMIHEGAFELTPFEQAGLHNIQRLDEGCKHACSFQNLLVVQMEVSSDWKHLGLEELPQPAQGFLGCAMVAECHIIGDAISARIYYDSKVISQCRIQWIANQFRHVIMQLNSLTGVVGEVDICSPEDQETLLQRNAILPSTVDRCIHHVFADRVAARPDAKAVSSWDQTFTYRHLDHFSSKLAKYLIELGVCPGQFIPLCFEKSAWIVVAMLSVLKAGGAFVALDPSQPAGRLQEISKEINSTVVLCSKNCLSVAKSFAEKAIIVDLSTVDTLEDYQAEILDRASPSDPAYAIFTSGTTGKPKGVLISHNAFSSGAAYHGQAMLQQESSRVLQFASYSFDASLVEILTPLMRGACICIPSEESRLNDLAGAINDLRVTWAVFDSIRRTNSGPRQRTRTQNACTGWRTDVQC